MVIIASGIYIVLRESTEAVSEETPVLRTSNYRIFSGGSLDPKGQKRRRLSKRSK